MSKPSTDTAGVAAWRKFKAPIQRTRYDFRPEVIRNLTAMERFRSRVTLDPVSGCWLWDGPMQGQVPITYVYNVDNQRTLKRSAFRFLMERWFAESAIKSGSWNNERTCGTSRCVSPRHRQHRSFEHLAKLTVEQIKEIYAVRYATNADDLAARFGVHRDTVYDVWSGRKHAHVTGQTEPRRIYRLSPSQAKEIYRRRGGKATKADIAKEFEVSESTIGQIWSGKIWATTTGHGLPS